MKKIIVNEEDMPETYLNAVLRKSIWIDEENLWLHPGMDHPNWKTYTYINTAQSQWEKTHPSEHLKGYDGSSRKGKDIPQDKMFKAQKASSKPIMIELLKSPDGTTLVNLIDPNTSKTDRKKIGFW